MKNKRKFAAVFLALFLFVGCAQGPSVASVDAAFSASSENGFPSESALSSEDKLPTGFSSIAAGDESSFSSFREEDFAENLEDFLNETQVLYWLDPAALKTIQETPLDQTSCLRVVISQVLMAYAEKNNLSVCVTEEGIPCFPIEDFTCAAAELFGLSCDFEQFAENSSDQAPEGMLCVSWGYDITASRIVVDRAALRTDQEQYFVQIEDYLPASAVLGNDNEVLRTKSLTFYVNQTYRFSPVQLISITEQ